MKIFEKDFYMPRRVRVAVAGIPWHIIQRGNHRSSCFYTEDDYLYYLEQVEQVRTATNGNYVLGNDHFKEEIELALGRRVTPGKRGRPKRRD